MIIIAEVTIQGMYLPQFLEHYHRLFLSRTKKLSRGDHTIEPLEMIVLTMEDLILDPESLGMIIEVILVIPNPGCLSATHDTWMMVY